MGKEIIYHTISGKFEYVPSSKVEGLETLLHTEGRPNLRIPITEKRLRLMGPRAEGCDFTQFDIPWDLYLKRRAGKYKVLYLLDD